MKKYLRYSLPILITILLAWFLLRNGIQWSDVRSILHQAQKGWLLFALLSTACAYGTVTWLNQILLKRYDARVPFMKQFLIQLAMAFIETAVPSAAISGVVLRARLLKPYGVSADIATATTMVETSLLTASLILPAILVSCIAMVMGIQGFGKLRNWLFILLGMTILIGVAIWQWNTPAFVDFRIRGIRTATHFWEKTIRPRWPKHFEHWSAQRVTERINYLWSESLTSVRIRPYSILFSLLTHFAFEALCLVLCFYALRQSLPFTTLLMLYPLTIAINTFGAVPGGVGLAEVSLSALYSQFGIAIDAAVVIALTYRLTGYWFPRVVGGLAWLWMERGIPASSIQESLL